RLNDETGDTLAAPSSNSSVGPSHPSPHFYQLTHDYLVPLLRDWLSRKQRETMRGRAELKLADRALGYQAQPENRQLPSLFEWIRFRSLTRKEDWSTPQRMMMTKATQY